MLPRILDGAGCGTSLLAISSVVMPAVHVRNVPEEVLDALKRRAARHERSLQRELRHLLCTTAQEEPAGEPLRPIELNFSDALPTSSWRRAEIYEDDGR